MSSFSLWSIPSLYACCRSGIRTGCIVDEDFAKRYWPNGGALGRRISNDPVFKEAEAFTIVGVVGRVKHNELGDAVAQGAVYYPYRYYASSGFFLVVQATGAAEPSLPGAYSWIGRSRAKVSRPCPLFQRAT